jgi:hypothetical protein
VLAGQPVLPTAVGATCAEHVVAAAQWFVICPDRPLPSAQDGFLTAQVAEAWTREFERLREPGGPSPGDPLDGQG